MNKLHVLALTGLMLFGMNNASMMGQEQREVLYTLNILGQDFINIPMITQNIDMFMGVLEMNIQVNEAKLQDADQKIKKSLYKNAVIVGCTALTHAFMMDFWLNKNWIILSDSASNRVLKKLILDVSATVFVSGRLLAGLGLYDAWNKRSELIEAIALDKEILGKLEEIKDSMSFLEENADSEGNLLLNSAE